MEPLHQGLNNIGIVGLGLIGGSLGLDLQNLGIKVYGLTNRESTAQRAKERCLAQVVSTDPKILANCSVIILALPLSKLMDPTDQLIRALPSHAVITDVGSVKAPVAKLWTKLHPRFIPSHPMAGTIKAGVEAGQRNLFKNRPWLATPSKGTDLKALEIVHELALLLGSKWITIDAEIHDQAVALISHLPVLVSTALLTTVGGEPNHSLLALAKTISSSGFADTTRVGAGNPGLGVDMANYNSESLLKVLHSYQLSLATLEQLIQSKQWDKLHKELETSNKLRTDFL